MVKSEVSNALSPHAGIEVTSTYFSLQDTRALIEGLLWKDFVIEDWYHWGGYKHCCPYTY